MQIGEISKITGVSISTLRYYDKHGLLKNVNRTKGRHTCIYRCRYRSSSNDSLSKKFGINHPRYQTVYGLVCSRRWTIDTRLNFMYKQEENIKNQMNLLTKSLKLIEFKQWYYETAKKRRNRTTCKKQWKYLSILLTYKNYIKKHMKDNITITSFI